MSLQDKTSLKDIKNTLINNIILSIDFPASVVFTLRTYLTRLFGTVFVFHYVLKYYHRLLKYLPNVWIFTHISPLMNKNSFYYNDINIKITMYKTSALVQNCGETKTWSSLHYETQHHRLYWTLRVLIG